MNLEKDYLKHIPRLRTSPIAASAPALLPSLTVTKISCCRPISGDWEATRPLLAEAPMQSALPMLDMLDMFKLFNIPM